MPLRSALESTCSPDEKDPAGRADQRPCSTHETSSTTRLFGATRKLAFATRFCLAPTISSPKSTSTETSPRLTSATWGTEPPPISSTCAAPDSSASARQM